MTNRDFDEWLSKFRPSISSYDYYIDFQKVVRNVDEIKVELNILNTLIGSKNIEADFEKIVTKYPETLSCIPLLLAVRGNEIYAQDEDGAFLYNFKKMNYSVEQYKVFMRKTGLFDMIANHLVNNLVDYALGIETGLDSNGRKNPVIRWKIWLRSTYSQQALKRMLITLRKCILRTSKKSGTLIYLHYLIRARLRRDLIL